MEQIAKNKVFGGQHLRYKHTSTSTQCDMTFAVFLPETASEHNKVPVLYWLSGLTCTDENFMQKSGVFNAANELGIAIVAPDTSPRGNNVPDDPEGCYDFGHGAGFYLDATQPPYSTHYKMYSYIIDELPELIESHFPVSDKKSISGHSMGGHGALTIGLKNQTRFSSISAFSPIVNPMACPWGVKAFSQYLGEDRQTWTEYDACELLLNAKLPNEVPILVDQGDADNFLEEQLLTKNFVNALQTVNYPNACVNLHEGYDHSYFFISTFIESHLAFHANYLK